LDILFLKGENDENLVGKLSFLDSRVLKKANTVVRGEWDHKFVPDSSDC